jgi:hypothetical protein
MKIKVYRVSPKDNPNIEYLVDAPNKGIARWCGANLCNHEYTGFHTAKDMKVKRFRTKALDDNTTICY